METFSALLALCAGSSPVTGEFPSQSPVTRSFDIFIDLRLNKRFNKHSIRWWFDMPLHPLWRHRNARSLNNQACFCSLTEHLCALISGYKEHKHLYLLLPYSMLGRGGGVYYGSVWGWGGGGGGGGTKPIPSLPLFSELFNIVKTHVRHWLSRLYLTGIVVA